MAQDQGKQTGGQPSGGEEQPFQAQNEHDNKGYPPSRGGSRYLPEGDRSGGVQPHDPSPYAPPPTGGPSTPHPPANPNAQTRFGDQPTGWSPPEKGPLIIGIIIVLAILTLLLLFISLRLWPFDSSQERTNDAYVRGLETQISPKISGYVTEVLVDDFEYVRKGQILVKIEPNDYQARVNQDEASLAAAEANLAGVAQQIESQRANITSAEASVQSSQASLLRAEADYRRAAALVVDGSISRQEYDSTWNSLKTARADLVQSQASLRVARENLTAAFVRRESLIASAQESRAQLQQSRLDLGYTLIRAPVSGQLHIVDVRRGSYVSAGTKLFYLVPPQLWVIANYKEAQTRAVRVGNRARFSVDGLGGKEFTGWVQAIAPGAANTFSSVNPDNATGNFVKVPQRVSIRIAIDPGQPYLQRLRPGLSVESVIDTATMRQGPAK